MDKQDIRTILDSLDVQVSMGRIDQPTYDALKQKWVLQLQEIEAREAGANAGSMVTLERATVAAVNTDSLPPEANVLLARPSAPLIEDQSHYTVEVLACPKCAAPAALKAGQDLSQPVQCPFCDTVYTVRQSQDNAQQLKQELKAWLDQMIVGSGYNGASGVDIHARHLIFSESLYPTLKKDIDRRLEAFENVLEAPLVQIKETKDFRDYQPNPRLIMLAKGDNQWLKTLSTRVSAQQLQDFAVVQDDKQRLRQLQMRVLSLIYYANIAQHQASSSVAAYQLVRQNIVALQQEYQSYVQEIADEHYRSYSMVLDARTTADILLLDLLISALGEGHNTAPEGLLLQIGNVLAQLDKAQQLALTCTYNPLYTVPLQQGIQKDITIARIFQAIVTSYEMVTRTRAEEFKPFYERLLKYVHSLAKIESAEHLLWLLTSIERVLLARAAEAPLPVVKNWTWLEPVADFQRRRSAFGTAAETGQVLMRHYHPYWIARLSYSEVGGVLVKKASVHEGFLLLDATSMSSPKPVPITGNDPVLPIMQAGLQNFQLLDKQIISLPAVLPYDKAEKAMKAYAHTHEYELKVLAVRMIGILYVPAASVRYTAKNVQRDVIVSCLRSVNQNLEQALKQTQEFLHMYQS